MSQVKLLRLLQEGDYYPLGSDTPKQHNTRFVFATNRDLSAMQKSGAFRSDLYYRLNAYRIHLPPLRERQDDIPLLLNRFLVEASTSLGKKIPAVSAQLIPLLQRYAFPGNIRELRAMVFEAVSLHRNGVLGLTSFQTTIQGEGGLSTGTVLSAHGVDSILYPEQLPTLKESADLLVDEAMSRANQNQTQAAKLLGISRPALSKRIKNRS
jgi:transcriptional regulator with PAS, ATPase and Fis domain